MVWYALFLSLFKSILWQSDARDQVAAGWPTRRPPPGEFSPPRLHPQRTPPVPGHTHLTPIRNQKCHRLEPRQSGWLTWARWAHLLPTDRPTWEVRLHGEHRVVCRGLGIRGTIRFTALLFWCQHWRSLLSHTKQLPLWWTRSVFSHVNTWGEFFAGWGPECLLQPRAQPRTDLIQCFNLTWFPSLKVMEPPYCNSPSALPTWIVINLKYVILSQSDNFKF